MTGRLKPELLDQDRGGSDPFTRVIDMILLKGRNQDNNKEVTIFTLNLLKDRFQKRLRL